MDRKAKSGLSDDTQVGGSLDLSESMINPIASNESHTAISSVSVQAASVQDVYQPPSLLDLAWVDATLSLTPARVYDYVSSE